MGCAESKSEEEREQEKASKIVENQLRKVKTDFLNEIKLLLLGTGESGKSTIAKQMKILHTNGYTEEERLNYKPIAHHNALQSMRVLTQSLDALGLKIEPENQEHLEKFIKVEQEQALHEEVTPDIATLLKKLWADKSIQQVYERRSEIQLMDSAKYCFENIDRLAASDWVPTNDDILHFRARTTGIVEITFVVKDTHFKMIDVGGQRSERKKWIHCFQEVTAIIYCVALNEYDMKLLEDEKVNRMQESLELFEYICNSKWFTKTAIILFLNKSDLFKDKIEKIPLKNVYPDFQGGSDFQICVDYIKDKFVALNQNQTKKIFAHTTQATDTRNVKVVFDAAKEIIISQNLERLGFGVM